MVFHMKTARRPANLKSSVLAFALFLSFSTTAFAGKFQPVRGEDWPETGETSSSPKGDQDDEEGSAMPDQPRGMPKFRMLPDGSPDPESLKEFLN